MVRGLRTFVMMALLALGSIPAQARGPIGPGDRWSAGQFEGLPAEVRRPVAARASPCGGNLAAEQSFAHYFQRGKAKLIGLNFERLRCSNRQAICTPAGCLQQVYISTGGPYRLLQSSYGAEQDLARLTTHDPRRR
jgi:hypothetical protein